MFFVGQKLSVGSQNLSILWFQFKAMPVYYICANFGFLYETPSRWNYFPSI